MNVPTHEARIQGGRVLLLLVLGLAPGCGSLREGGSWGHDALYPVQWARIPQAAKRALLDPATWVPAAGAAVFKIDNWDRKTSDWASQHTPVFGSKQTANDASDWLRNALAAEVFATAVLTPSGPEPLEWTWSKAKGLGVEYGAILLNNEATGWIKDWAGRERPDGNGNESFPSGHASAAAVSARLSNRNLDSIEMQPWLRRTFQTGNFLMAGGTSWARVEAQRHFPSDVLAGMALGNFISTFIHDAFLNLPDKHRLSLRIEPSRQALNVGLAWEF